MYSVGGFREAEINGKPFHIYIFLSQTDTPGSSSSVEAAIDSGDDDLPLLQPLFICPSSRPSSPLLFRGFDDPNGKVFLPVDVYPQVFDKRSNALTCKRPLVPLFWCNNKEPNDELVLCWECHISKLGTDYLFCVTCDKMFHKECIECPLEIKHPSYPFTSLKLYYPPNSMLVMPRCICCQEDIYHILYYCPIYNLSLHLVCAVKPIPIVIDNPRRHPHPLIFFPKQNSLPCDVCGLIKEHSPTYVCARCVFVVHQDCIYHPYVIRICRHQHRISFTYSLLSGELSCGVCRRKVDNNYGAYSCNKCGDYFVHTKCALREDLWDGLELEGIPEEPEIVIEPPFKTISDGIILHFSHDHHLKLEINKVYDEEKFCQACVLPIYEGNFYFCMDQCDFILHEACANAPCKKQHPLHAHSLALKVVTNEYWGGKGHFPCRACRRQSCGFVYEDPIRFARLDLRCASVSEPFQYEGHEHPLFLALTPEEEKSAICQICEEEGDEDSGCQKLTCIECHYIICFRCATLPYKARYQHDKHFLTFREKEEASDHPGWCDICEHKIVYSEKGGFYSCDDYCSTTIHVSCLLGGEDLYMKPGQTIESYPDKAQILRNKTMSRPFCHRCKWHCPHKVVFKKRNMTFCSSLCLSLSRK